MKQAALLLCFGLGAITGCGRAPAAMQLSTDMAAPPIADLAEPDLAQATCGAIVSCIIASGTSNPTGALGCFQNASQMGSSEAVGLFLCAAQNCLGGDGGATGGLGGGNQLGLLQCLTMSCQTQLSACQGLPF